MKSVIAALLLPQRAALLRLCSSDRRADSKEWLLRQRYPAAFDSLRRQCLPGLRRAELHIIYIKRGERRVDSMECRVDSVECRVDSVEFATALGVCAESEAVANSTLSTLHYPLSAKSPNFYPRTNLLLPLLNFGLELPIGNRWSVGADWYYPWAFRRASHRDCFQIDGLSLEGRYWLGQSHTADDANRPQRLLGHAVGLFVMGGRYDLERDYSGHQGEYIIGGADYLYAMPLFRGKAHLELSLGVGYFYSRATRYSVFVWGGKGYRDRNFHKVFQYFGPAKANVTLVLPLRFGRTPKTAEP